MTPNKLAIYFVADMVVADIDFLCGRYGFFAVADMAIADMVCGRYGPTPIIPRVGWLTACIKPLVTENYTVDD